MPYNQAFGVKFVAEINIRIHQNNIFIWKIHQQLLLCVPFLFYLYLWLADNNRKFTLCFRSHTHTHIHTGNDMPSHMCGYFRYNALLSIIAADKNYCLPIYYRIKHTYINAYIHTNIIKFSYLFRPHLQCLHMRWKHADFVGKGSTRLTVISNTKYVCMYIYL